MTAEITNANHAKAFLTAGKATLTIVSVATEKRFTFRVLAADNGDGFFVRVLVGSDNENDYAGIGFLNTKKPVPKFWPAKHGKRPDAAAAFEWFARNLFERGGLSAKAKLYHEGRCGRCARLLTVPSSIASGIGPECASKLGFVAEAA